MIRRVCGRLGLVVIVLVLTRFGAGSAATAAVPGTLAVGATPVQGSTVQDPELDAATRAVASELRCPVCQGLSIQDSPTDLAREMRAVVREQLAAGRTAAEVRAYFVSKYGEWILLEPPAHGFNLAVYLLPLAALLCGGGFIAFVVRRWTRQGTAAKAQDGAVEADPSIGGGV